MMDTTDLHVGVIKNHIESQTLAIDKLALKGFQLPDKIGQLKVLVLRVMRVMRVKTNG